MKRSLDFLIPAMIILIVVNVFVFGAIRVYKANELAAKAHSLAVETNKKVDLLIKSNATNGVSCDSMYVVRAKVLENNTVIGLALDKLQAQYYMKGDVVWANLSTMKIDDDDEYGMKVELLDDYIRSFKGN
jgi:hypothetical protein